MYREIVMNITFPSAKSVPYIDGLDDVPRLSE